MQITKHAAVSVAAGLGLYALTHSLIIAFFSLIAGIFLDLDHIIDYWREHPFKLDLAHFFATCEEYKLNKAYLFLHSAELLLPLAFFTYFTKSSAGLGFTAGFLIHMICDQLANRVYPCTYSFIYRWTKGFSNQNVFCINQELFENGKPEK